MAFLEPFILILDGIIHIGWTNIFFCWLWMPKYSITAYAEPNNVQIPLELGAALISFSDRAAVWHARLFIVIR